MLVDSPPCFRCGLPAAVPQYRLNDRAFCGPCWAEVQLAHARRYSVIPSRAIAIEHLKRCWKAWIAVGSATLVAVFWLTKSYLDYQERLTHVFEDTYVQQMNKWDPITTRYLEALNVKLFEMDRQLGKTLPDQGSPAYQELIRSISDPREQRRRNITLGNYSKIYIGEYKSVIEYRLEWYGLDQTVGSGGFGWWGWQEVQYSGLEGRTVTITYDYKGRASGMKENGL